MKTLLALTITLCALVYALPTPLNDVKSGKAILVCNDKIVPPSKVVDFIDNTWIFTNGHAKNCFIEDKK